MTENKLSAENYTPDNLVEERERGKKKMMKKNYDTFLCVESECRSGLACTYLTYIATETLDAVSKAGWGGGGGGEKKMKKQWL